MNHSGAYGPKILKRLADVVLTIVLAVSLAITGMLPGTSLTALAQPGRDPRPNILVLMPDDIGWFNVSAYNRGMMGYRTPNIDRIAEDGILFTDAYAENSCTAGRSAFILGQSPGRSGLVQVQMSGSDFGITDQQLTLAEVLKEEGYATGQFGKNHLGDGDKHLPSNHGFEIFFGNLYHLNNEEDPENPDYPEDPYADVFGPRGVILSYDTRADIAPSKAELEAQDICEDGLYRTKDTVTPQLICDTGALTIKRMETVDEEFLEKTKDFMEDSVEAGKPFLAWFNPTRMHIYTHLKEESKGVTGQGIYGDGMFEHDAMVGELLDKLDELGVADNTIVIYTTDNGAEIFSWPDGGTTPFHGEKNTNWEGGFRVPLLVRWPQRWAGGKVSNAIISHQDWFPTLTEAAGIHNIDEVLRGRCIEGLKALGKTDSSAICGCHELVVYEANGKEFGPIYLDGYNFLPYLDGLTSVTLPSIPESPRKEFIYFTDDGNISSHRFGDWKALYRQQRAKGLDVWSEPFIELRIPKIINLRRDPFERAIEESEEYPDWQFRRIFLLPGSSVNLQRFGESLHYYNPSCPAEQSAATSSAESKVNSVLERLKRIPVDYTRG